MKRNIQNSDKITRKNADIDHVCASPPSSVMHALDESWLVSMVAFFFYPLPSPLSTPILLKESFFVNLLKKLFLLFFFVKELLPRILIFITIEILSSSVCIMKFNQIFEILFECLFYPKKIQVASRQSRVHKQNFLTLLHQAYRFSLPASNWNTPNSDCKKFFLRFFSFPDDWQTSF